MSGRRPRVSARPNIARGNRGTAVSQQSKATDSSGSVETPSNKEQPVENTSLAAEAVAAQCVPEASPADPADSSAEVTAASTAAAAVGQTDWTKHVKDLQSLAEGNRRRSKFQAKPQLSRKPRTTPTTPAQSTHTAVTEAKSGPTKSGTTVDVVDKGQGHTQSMVADTSVPLTPSLGSSMHSPVLVQDTSMPSPAPVQDNSIPSPALVQDSCMPSPAIAQDNSMLSPAPVQDHSMLSPAPVQDHYMPSPRHFKPRTKPNVVEAGKARMRRLSESLDLSPHLSTSRRRHTSSSAGDNLSESVVRVEPVNSTVSPTSEESAAPAFPAAEKKAKRRKEFIANINREIEEQEELEMMAEGEAAAPTKSKRTRKVRRLIKSDQAPDTSTMTIKDLIYYQPTSNPLPQREDSRKGKEKEVSKQQVERDNPAVTPATPATPAEPELDIAPQLMIGEDGQVIINQQSLTVQQASQQPLDYEDITVDKDDEGATYASFRPNSMKNSKMWTSKETEQFYKALNAIGTDFSLMCQLFPKRTRADLKKKFKKEERSHLAKVQLAMHGKLKFDAEPFPELDLEQEKLDKKKEKQANKKDQRKSRGGAKVRTYYDVANADEFRDKLAYKRRGYIKENNAGSADPSGNAESTVGIPLKKLLTLNTQATLEDASSANQRPDVHILTSPSTLSTLSPSAQPVNPRPIPSISTMLDQNPKINDKISNLLLSNRTPVRPSASSAKNSDLVLSPLYNLDNGDTIMVSTKTIPGTDKKMHHLYLFSPPRGGATGCKAIGSLDPISIGITRQTVASPRHPALAPKTGTDSRGQVPAESSLVAEDEHGLPHSHRQSPAHDMGQHVPYPDIGQVSLADVNTGQAPFYEQSATPSPNSPANTCHSSPVHLTRLVTPEAARDRTTNDLITTSTSADPFVSHSVVTATARVPTRKLGWEPVLDEFGVVTEGKQLAFTNL